MTARDVVSDHFEQYREYLHAELQRMVSYAAVYKRIEERKADRLKEMNIAPAFFGVAADALYSGIIIWVDKLLDENGDRGFFNLLSFVENNRDCFSIESLRQRQRYSDGHWMLDRDEITFASIERDRERLRSAPGLKSIQLRRDKFHAHFDKKYFFDPSRFKEEAPIKWSDLDAIVALLREILNTYSAGYDGKLFAVTPFNIGDIDHLLDRLHKADKESG
jgi:AbiU2